MEGMVLFTLLINIQDTNVIQYETSHMALNSIHDMIRWEQTGNKSTFIYTALWSTSNHLQG